MAVNIPPQRHRCTRHEWCVERGHAHEMHAGEAQVLATSRGTEIRLSLTAEGDEPPVVQMEAAFERGGPMMELAELDATEAVELAGFLLRLARVAEDPATRSADPGPDVRLSSDNAGTGTAP